MRIRTQIIVAFLLLSVLPLTAIVLYSYITSSRALRQAYEEEAGRLTREMNGRIAAVREGIDEALERAGELPAPVLVAIMRQGNQPVARRVIANTLGEAAPLVERFEFVPTTTAGHHPPVSIDVDAILRDAQAAGARAITPEAMEEIRQSVAAAREAARAAAAADADQSEPAEPADPDPPAEGEAADDAAEAIEALQQLEIDRQAEAIERAQRVQERAREHIERRISELEEEHEQLLEQGDESPDVERRRRIIEARIAALNEEQSRLLLGKDFEVNIEEDGEVIGTIRAQVSGKQVVNAILGASEREEGEIPFAIDRAGNLYTATPTDRAKLAPMRASLTAAAGDARPTEQKYVVASSRDPDSGLLFGIARPIAEPLQQVRRTAARNFTYGLALIVVALIGIVPIANHMTRDLETVRAGAERIAQGDLTTRLPVRTGNEIGQLARAFNRMAQDLSLHQQELLEQDRIRQEYTRKSEELEDARAFQISLLPKELPLLASFEVAVMMRTATEVGGDYYDFLVDSDETLTTAVGDATGHGARAATMVTIIKSLFAAAGGTQPLGPFLTDAAATIRRMELGRMAMALTMARFRREGVEIASAGMPPLLIYRAALKVVEEIAIEGVPLGTIPTDYSAQFVPMEKGDVAVLMSDGLPELLNVEGEPFGYTAVEQVVAQAGTGAPQAIVSALARAADTWAAGRPPNDDITFVVIRRT
jgi:serine phosphatase RsbU (regulator of sigma subunit)